MFMDKLMKIYNLIFVNEENSLTVLGTVKVINDKKKFLLLKEKCHF